MGKQMMGRDSSWGDGGGGWLEVIVIQVNSTLCFVFQLLDDKSTMYKGHVSTSVAKLKLYYRTCMNVTKIEEEGTEPMLKVVD